MTIEEIAKKDGYLLKNDTVQTEDGYLIKIFHLTRQNRTEKRPAVFLLHGLLDSSDSWMINKENSIAYMLDRKGFDVYMGNYRGNKYSLGHISLNTSQDEFWQNS